MMILQKTKLSLGALAKGGALILAATALVEPAVSQHKGNWLHWRGPLQTGVSLEHYEKGEFNPEPVWSLEQEGRGTPVIHDGRLYSWTYRGEGPNLVEVVAAHDAETGEILWEREFSDFISDTVYNRYTIGAPTVDPETGNLFLHTTYGLFMCLDREGNTIWEISMQERFGRLTFPNGRAGAPVIDGKFVLTRAVTSFWGAEGPARDRFFAFDKDTGDLIWSSAPGVGPPYLKDTSFSNPFLMTRNGRRVFYVGLGCGNLACVNLADGTPLWRFQFSLGGVNSSPVVHDGDKLIAIHGTENIDTTETGRMVAVKLPENDADVPGAEVEEGQGGAPKVPADQELWRQHINMFTSSPVLVDDRIYQVSHEGELHCVNAENGEILWKEKLGTGQLHASPAYVDGYLIVPMVQKKIYVIKPTDEKAEIVHVIETEGDCLGSPAICNGWVYVQTMEHLHAFKFDTGEITYDEVPEEEPVEKGPATGFTAVPTEVLLLPGDRISFELHKTDANGNWVGEVDPTSVDWASFIPPTARVKVEMDAEFKDGQLVAPEDASVSAGMFKGTAGDLTGTVRGRVLEDIPFSQDFEGFKLTTEDPATGTKFAYPPLPWIGARLKWEVRELEGNKVLAKTLDNILFQRAMSFIGHPDSSNYTIQADVMTDGNRRVKSTVGLVNQHYICALVGNSNLLEVSSNHERVKQNVPFTVAANTWYTLKVRVDLNEDGSGVVRAKAWERGSDEPDKWTIEAEHKNAHKEGSPGLFGFSPQSQKSVFIDNLKITPNE